MGRRSHIRWSVAAIQLEENLSEFWTDPETIKA